ncbi:hypothetical protein BD311DRAFT_62653 [Dichomitus squalens]|uniref:Uncharacterized protein n=1 Tax=Dichomitus squalens TaxID=114155 RepID=A0A4Q9M9G3_9APHY|nr:hypothetical protein BD311DRAFT_62653 [Dichomitus squalens]
MRTRFQTVRVSQSGGLAHRSWQEVIHSTSTAILITLPGLKATSPLRCFFANTSVIFSFNFNRGSWKIGTRIGRSQRLQEERARRVLLSALPMISTNGWPLRQKAGRKRTLTFTSWKRRNSIRVPSIPGGTPLSMEHMALCGRASLGRPHLSMTMPSKPRKTA